MIPVSLKINSSTHLLQLTPKNFIYATCCKSVNMTACYTVLTALRSVNIYADKSIKVNSQVILQYLGSFT